MKPLVLFDIDKTLSSSSDAHRHAFQAALRDVHGIDLTIDEIRKVKTSGMTEPAIERMMLLSHGKKPSPEGSKEYEKVMGRRLGELIKDDPFALMPGVQGLFSDLERKGAVLGLATGNFEASAWHKMKRLGIDHFFSLGGFGSDHEDRAELVRVAIRRGKKKSPEIDRVVVIGDTPLDIAAAKGAGALSIGVASGHYSQEELLKAGADLVIESLEEKEKILRFIFSLSS
ncbi:MAG: HAD family hydrolase [Nanoarchaeota archaeon]